MDRATIGPRVGECTTARWVGGGYEKVVGSDRGLGVYPDRLHRTLPARPAGNSLPDDRVDYSLDGIPLGAAAP